MSRVNQEQPTLEEVQHWQELDEVDCYAFAGKPINDEEFMEAFEFIMDDNKIEKLLEKISNKKQKLMSQLQHLENYETNLSKHISERINKT